MYYFNAIHWWNKICPWLCYRNRVHLYFWSKSVCIFHKCYCECRVNSCRKFSPSSSHGLRCICSDSLVYYFFERLPVAPVMTSRNLIPVSTRMILTCSVTSQRSKYISTFHFCWFLQYARQPQSFKFLLMSGTTCRRKLNVNIYFGHWSSVIL